MPKLRKKGALIILDEIGFTTTSGGKWWENSHPDTLLDYINHLEEIIEEQERQIAKLKESTDKKEVVSEFLMSSNAVLAPDEFVFLCLRLAGFKYALIQDVVTSLSKSDSTIQRKVQLAMTKMLNCFSI